jgi:hypothetical protein
MQSRVQLITDGRIIDTKFLLTKSERLSRIVSFSALEDAYKLTANPPFSPLDAEPYAGAAHDAGYDVCLSISSTTVRLSILLLQAYMTCVLYARAVYLLANKEDGLPLAVDSPALVPYLNRLYVNRSNSYFYVLGAEGAERASICRAIAHCFSPEPVDTSRVLYISGFPAHTRQDELLSHLRCVLQQDNRATLIVSQGVWLRSVHLGGRSVYLCHVCPDQQAFFVFPFCSWSCLHSLFRVESIAHVREVLRKFAGLCSFLCAFALVVSSPYFATAQPFRVVDMETYRASSANRGDVALAGSHKRRQSAGAADDDEGSKRMRAGAQAAEPSAANGSWLSKVTALFKW